MQSQAAAAWLRAKPSRCYMSFRSSVDVTQTGLLQHSLTCSQHLFAQPHNVDQSKTHMTGPKMSVLFHTICKILSTANPGAVFILPTHKSMTKSKLIHTGGAFHHPKSQDFLIPFI